MAKHSPENATAGLTRRAGTWLAARLRGQARIRRFAAFDELNDHLLKDVGIWRERSAGPRRYDPWM